MSLTSYIARLLRGVTPPSTYKSLASLAQQSLPSMGNYFRFARPDEKLDLASNELGQIFLQHSGLTVRKWMHYIEIYGELFSEFKGMNLRFLEIGVAGGGSLEIWQDYFGAKAEIIGVDIDPRCRDLERVGKLVRTGSQSDQVFLGSIIEELKSVTIVLDDGSHIGSDQVASFKALWPHLEPGGLYIIEDLHASFWKEFNSTLDVSFIPTSFDLVESLYSQYAQIESNEIIEVVGNSVHSVVFFDSIIAVKKKARQTPLRVTFP